MNSFGLENISNPADLLSSVTAVKGTGKEGEVPCEWRRNWEDEMKRGQALIESGGRVAAAVSHTGGDLIVSPVFGRYTFNHFKRILPLEKAVEQNPQDEKPWESKREQDRRRER